MKLIDKDFQALDSLPWAVSVAWITGEDVTVMWNCKMKSHICGVLSSSKKISDGSICKASRICVLRTDHYCRLFWTSKMLKDFFLKIDAS